MGCFLVSKFTSHRLYPSNEGHGPESPGPWLTLQPASSVEYHPQELHTHTHTSRHTTNNRHVQTRQGTCIRHMHAVLLQIITLNCVYYYYYYTQWCLRCFQTLSAWPGHGPHPACNQDFPAQFRSTSRETWHHLHGLIKTSLQVLSHKWQAIAFAVHGWCRHSIDSSAATAQQNANSRTGQG